MASWLHSLDTRRGPLTATFADAWAQRHAPLASFFGVGLGAAFVDRAAHPAAKTSAGVEAFHYGPVPIQLGVDLIATWCTNASDQDCGTTQARTYFAGRLVCGCKRA